MIREKLKAGMPCMAECGGFMYLHEEMEGMDGNFYQMAGVIPGKAYRTPKLSRFGYVTLTQKKPALGMEDFERSRHMSSTILIPKTAAGIFMRRSRRVSVDGTVSMERTRCWLVFHIFIIMEIPKYRRHFLKNASHTKNNDVPASRKVRKSDKCDLSYDSPGSRFLLDLIFGDPRWLYHPVCLIGNLISVLEKGIRRIFPKTNAGELAGGVVETILVCLFSFGVPAVLLSLLYGHFPVAGVILETFWCYQLLATRSLKDESMKVYDRLVNGTIEEARYAVSMIVGRDTQELTDTGVTKAAVETVAENCSDGVIAPMIYMAIGGAPLMFLYKGINTMDSMLGYKNDKYLYFGRCSAKLDDVANFFRQGSLAG